MHLCTVIIVKVKYRTTTSNFHQSTTHGVPTDILSHSSYISFRGYLQSWTYLRLGSLWNTSAPVSICYFPSFPAGSRLWYCLGTLFNNTELSRKRINHDAFLGLKRMQIFCLCFDVVFSSLTAAEGATWKGLRGKRFRRKHSEVWRAIATNRIRQSKQQRGQTSDGHEGRKRNKANVMNILPTHNSEIQQYYCELGYVHFPWK